MCFDGFMDGILGNQETTFRIPKLDDNDDGNGGDDFGS